MCRMTPTSYAPRAAPPARTRATRGFGAGAVIANGLDGSYTRRRARDPRSTCLCRRDLDLDGVGEPPLDHDAVGEPPLDHILGMQSPSAGTSAGLSGDAAFAGSVFSTTP